MPKNWHAMPKSDVERELNVTANGLSAEEARKRLEEHGPNELTHEGKRSVWAMFFSQFKDFMVGILIVAAVVSGLLGEVVDAVIILVLVILNAVLGTVQEVKAEKSLEALQKLSAPNAKVIRDGRQVIVPARELVAGDLVVLDTGDYVPADLRLVEYASLKIQESALTGESVPVEKGEAELSENCALGDRINMAYSSSLVTYGRGRGIVVETGMNTEVGKIAAMIQSAPATETPMQRRLNVLGKTLGIVALSVCGVMFVVGLLYGKDLLDMFMTAVSLAVAAIPEGLPAISTIVLAMGVQRMVRRNAIVRTLPSVETLGSATVICSDKTGTLTQNRMVVMEYAMPGMETSMVERELQNEELLNACILCTDVRRTDAGLIGDPTEVALVELSERHGLKMEDLHQKAPRVDELPFDSDRKLMTTVNDHGDGSLTVHTKGGLDEVLNICTAIRTSTGERPITEEDKEELRKLNTGMAVRALRVLAFATKRVNEVPKNKSELESGLTFVAMVGMIDPPRPEAKEAVAKCHLAGITPVMITGDHALTATAIAKELDILHEGGRVVTGVELEAMSDEQLYDEVEHISVYARVSPEHKMRIVDAWQKHDNIVAMTGDGVNDAPALKMADIGCSMGIVGTDVAKDASDVILTDDNFATVVSAVEEGRRIFDNILKSIAYLLSCNVGEILCLFIATLLNWDEPLLPIHLLFVNLVTDGLPAMALGVDPASPDIMSRPARKNKGIFTGGMV
ncbi:MAG: cation-translocating P-type ATPase, partial [Christensenellales bacterium]